MNKITMTLQVDPPDPGRYFKRKILQVKTVTTNSVIERSSSWRGRSDL